MAEAPEKIGPYGGPGGNSWDISSSPTKLVSVKIWSVDENEGGVINGIAFTYNDGIPSGPHGTTSGVEHPIILLQGEKMIRVSGTTDGERVTSLKFGTDKHDSPYGPYGAQSEKGLVPFSFAGNTLAFFGRDSPDKIDAIGTYSRPN